MAKLRLDVKDGGAFEERSGRHLIVPGDSAQSTLFQRISSDRTGFRMPPASAGAPLTTEQAELVRKWIDQGARWGNHWAYVAPKRPEVPQASNGLVRNPIDGFVLARLEREGLKPAVEADKVTLIRRVTLDLTGVPPTIAEVSAFTADKRADAYEKLVDRLLHSPRYGERMAMQWLDLARYADTHGYHIDSSREMWHWRDWVIKAFNDNMPFDRFTVEQLAGDLLPGATDAQKVASGFNRNHMINFEGGAIPEEYQNEYVVDRVEATATTWMGMTLGCARCHDHKYDPLSQKEFYRFYAFFNSISEEGLDGKRGNAKPFLPLPSVEQKVRLDGLDREIEKREKLVDKDATGPLQQKWEADRLATLASVTRDGLTAHYAMDGNLSDSSGAYRLGRVRQGDLTFSPGHVDRAADFDSDTDVTLGDSGVVDLGGAFTIAAWVRVGASKTMGLFATVPEAKNGVRLEVGLDDFQLVDIQKWAPRVTIRVGTVELRSKDRLQPDQWHHVAVASDGSGRGLKLFLEGKAVELETVKDGKVPPGASRSALEIGNKALGRAFKGSIDELRVYNRALAAADLEPMVMSEPVRATLLMLEAKRNKAQQDRLRDHFLTFEAPQEFRTAWVELNALQKERAELVKVIPTAMVMSEMEKPRETVVLGRGDYRNRGEKVTPGVPSVLPPLPAGASANRLTLAQWLVSPENPLTARVAVNRFWQMYFGLGIVKTAEDFGSQGEPPSNPELLDWLATEFQRTGWDIREMQRLIVTSATYRQVAAITPELLEKDPENRLLARGPRFRLPAEMIRDSALSVSGLLRERVGGPSVYPNQPSGLWEAIAFGDGFSSQSYAPSTGDDLYRRSMYSFWKRTSPPPGLIIFDAPDREKCTARRLLTNTPLQALALMNDPTYVEAARGLAARILAEADKGTDARIRYAFRLAVAREPRTEEIRILRELEQKEVKQYRSDPEAAAKLTKGAAKLDAAELAAWTTVASSILNLDEMITKQ